MFTKLLRAKEELLAGVSTEVVTVFNEPSAALMPREKINIHHSVIALATGKSLPG